MCFSGTSTLKALALFAKTIGSPPVGADWARFVGFRLKSYVTDTIHGLKSRSGTNMAG